MAVETSELCFMLNGKLVVVDNPDPQQLLVHYLRQSGHTGTKVKLSSFVIGSTKRFMSRNFSFFFLTSLYETPLQNLKL